MDRADEMERRATQDEALPDCSHCGHAATDHEEGVCYECVCVDYEPEEFDEDE